MRTHILNTNKNESEIKLDPAFIPDHTIKLCTQSKPKQNPTIQGLSAEGAPAQAVQSDAHGAKTRDVGWKKPGLER